MALNRKSHCSLQNFSAIGSAAKFSLLVLFATLMVALPLKLIAGISIYELIADPTEVAKISPFTGLFSQISIFQWAAAAGICFFTATFQKRNDFEAMRWNSFLLFSGGLSILLLLDDTFQLHESYYHLFLGDTVSRLLKNLFELAFFGLYALFLGVYIIHLRKLYNKTNYQILLLSIILFAVSTLIDLVSADSSALGLVEESFKLLGISTWLVYLADCCSTYIRMVGNMSNEH